MNYFTSSLDLAITVSLNVFMGLKITQFIRKLIFLMGERFQLLDLQWFCSLSFPPDHSSFAFNLLLLCFLLLKRLN